MYHDTTKSNSTICITGNARLRPVRIGPEDVDIWKTGYCKWPVWPVIIYSNQCYVFHRKNKLKSLIWQCFVLCEPCSLRARQAALMSAWPSAPRITSAFVHRHSWLQSHTWEISQLLLAFSLDLFLLLAKTNKVYWHRFDCLTRIGDCRRMPYWMPSEGLCLVLMVAAV